MSRPDRPLTRADVMTAAEVAEVLGLSRSRVYAGADRGEIPCVRLGRIVRFARWQIEALLAGELDTATSTESRP